ncbi:hypothetical protein EGW08_021950 [Elysia chlorotica]|uniref:Uncharacterized protein n=1 Tax=Elysia chlorotica TaxID=188477 RepID=A0A3S1BM29_ELYCH|nr:hypothetical protein EGW08_021950 [Elysia chlorotica]
MAVYDFVKGMVRKRADPKKQQFLSNRHAGRIQLSSETNTQLFDGANDSEHPNSAGVQNTVKQGGVGVGPTQTVTIESGNMAFLVVCQSNNNGTGPVTVYVSGKGDVACDGDLITKSRVLDAGRRSYCLTSWGGCVEVTFSLTEAECVYANKTNTPGSMLLNVLSVRNVLVMDDTHSTAITAANYAYSFGMADECANAGNRVPSDAVFVDIAVKLNSGALYVYPMENGMIPPHHPADYIPNLKIGLWVGTEFTDLKRAVDELMGTILKGSRVVGYINPGAYAPDELGQLASYFDACFTVGEYTTHMMLGRAVTFRGNSFTDVDQVRLLRPVDNLEFAVRRHVFENSIVGPHHMVVTPSLNNRLMNFIPSHIRSGGCGGKKMFMKARPGQKFRAHSAYAVVIYVIDSDYDKNAFPDMHGFAYCDNNNYVHCLFPEVMCKTICWFVELGPCILS